MGKVEGSKENWHGHVTCLSVAPEFRRQGVSKILMTDFEKTSEMLVSLDFIYILILINFNQ